MDLIVDIQFLRDDNKSYTPKEVAVISLQGNVVGHWLIKSPVIFQNLPLDIKITNNFVTKELHGVEWFDGDITLNQLKSHLYEVARNARLIYVRGAEKAKFLESFICRHAVNLEIYVGPTFSKLRKDLDVNTVCAFHSRNRDDKNHDFCALNKVYLLKRWFRSIVPAEWISESKTFDLPSKTYYAALTGYMREMRNLGAGSGEDEVDNVSITDDESIYASPDTSKNNTGEKKNFCTGFTAVKSKKKISKEGKNEHIGDNAGDSVATKENKNNRCLRG